MSEVNPSIFHAYDIRGLYPQEIDAESAYRIAWAFGKYLLRMGEGNLRIPANRLQIAVGMDMRGSSPFLAREVVRGLNDLGIDAVDLGRVPTPAFYYAAAFKNLAGGVMVTASHMTKEYNGLKLCVEQAYPVAENTGLMKIKEYALSDEEVKPVSNTTRGKLIALPEMAAEYVRQDLSYVDASKITKLKIVADPGNAMGAVYLDELFKIIPCDPIKINWDLNGNMPIHEANPLKLETLQQMQAVIQNEKADFGIAPDGDGDRLAFLDERGDIIPPAIVLGLVAGELLKKYPGAKIGFDLRSSRVAREMIEAAGGIPVETKVGHSNIKAQMAKDDILFACELSMHYYLHDNFNFESPVFVTAMLLKIRSELDKPFSGIWRAHQKYSHSGEINFEVSDKQAVLEKLGKKYADGKVSKLDGLKVDYDDWWFNARPSNTENLLRLNLEAGTEEEMKKKVEEIKNVIASAAKQSQ